MSTKVRLVFDDNRQGETIRMSFVPRVGEILETYNAEYVVEKVIHAPWRKGHNIQVNLKKIRAIFCPEEPDPDLEDFMGVWRPNG